MGGRCEIMATGAIAALEAPFFLIQAVDKLKGPLIVMTRGPFVMAGSSKLSALRECLETQGVLA